ncbi:MAG: transposase like protein [Clostridia bacterium]|nr:transposase like protein [Clostridia bacterium]
MPRQARNFSPTGYYHVMMRGNNRENIFNRNEQKADFLNCIIKQEEDLLIDIAAYCLMDNHVHIVIKAELSDLAKAIKSTNIKYAMKFNFCGDRVGHVFQDRYKSEIITDEKYLLQVIRYIHNNPVKAKMVKSCSDYQWSSYNEYMNENLTIGTQQKDFILGYFSNSLSQFAEFHKQYDINEYLEIDEDLQKSRLERGQEIISKYFEETGLIDRKQVLKNPAYLEGITNKLLQESKLSHSQISNLLGVSKSTVHRINLRVE